VTSTVPTYARTISKSRASVITTPPFRLSPVCSRRRCRPGTDRGPALERRREARRREEFPAPAGNPPGNPPGASEAASSSCQLLWPPWPDRPSRRSAVRPVHTTVGCRVTGAGTPMTDRHSLPPGHRRGGVSWARRGRFVDTPTTWRVIVARPMPGAPGRAGAPKCRRVKEHRSASGYRPRPGSRKSAPGATNRSRWPIVVPC